MEAFTNLMRKDLQAIYERREVVKHISLWVIHGGDKIADKQNELIATAKTRAYLQLATIIPQDVEDLRAPIKAARERGVAVKIVSFLNRKLVVKKSLTALSEAPEAGIIKEPSEESPLPRKFCFVEGRIRLWSHCRILE